MWSFNRAKPLSNGPSILTHPSKTDTLTWTTCIVQSLRWTQAGPQAWAAARCFLCPATGYGHRSCWWAAPSPARARSRRGLRDPARNVGVMGLHLLWERRGLSWATCCLGPCPKLGYDIIEDQKDTYPSWILNELVLLFQNTKLLCSQERFQSWIQKKAMMFSEALEWKRQDLRYPGYSCAWHFMEKCYEGRLRVVWAEAEAVT